MDVHPSELSPQDASHRRRRWRWFGGSILLITVTVLVWVFAFGLSRDPSVVASALRGQPAPEFALRTLDGEDTIRLSDMRGRVAVVNFWASWCTPCIEEHAALAAAWARYRDRGVVVVGILFQDTPSNGIEFMQRLGGDWPVVEDPNSRTALAFGVAGVPETFFVGPNGRISHREVGAVTYEVLTEQITRLLQQEAR